MEGGEPGGSWNTESHRADAVSNDMRLATADTGSAVTAKWWLSRFDFAGIRLKLSKPTLRWQQGCDWDMLALPHCSAMCLQQARSTALSAAVGIRHIIVGAAARTS